MYGTVLRRKATLAALTALTALKGEYLSLDLSTDLQKRALPAVRLVRTFPNE